MSRKLEMIVWVGKTKEKRRIDERFMSQVWNNVLIFVDVCSAMIREVALMVDGFRTCVCHERAVFVSKRQSGERNITLLHGMEATEWYQRQWNRRAERTWQRWSLLAKLSWQKIYLFEDFSENHETWIESNEKSPWTLHRWRCRTVLYGAWKKGWIFN